MYYRARYYNPAIGRFVSEDPLRFGAAVNMYFYVGNAPVTFVDPNGLEGEIPFKIHRLLWDQVVQKCGLKMAFGCTLANYSENVASCYCQQTLWCLGWRPVITYNFGEVQIYVANDVERPTQQRIIRHEMYHYFDYLEAVKRIKEDAERFQSIIYPSKAICDASCQIFLWRAVRTIKKSSVLIDNYPKEYD
jgi:hypothetical protein